MRLGKRTVCLITAICFIFIVSCFFTTPVFAASNVSPSNNTPDIQTGIANQPDETDKASPEINTTESDTTTTSTTDSTIILHSTQSDEDSTGSALELDSVTTSEAIKVQKPENNESLWYSSEISMKKEHQKLLWDYCQKRDLNYIDMLALISLESNFDEKCSSGKCKGYFQISTGHGANLSKTLKTLNKPLDGAVNINWGTAMYSWILADKRLKGLEGKKQRDVALSIYQRGTGGYDKFGINKSYLKKYYKKWDKIVSYFEK